MYLIVYKENHKDGGYTERRLKLSLAHTTEQVLSKIETLKSNPNYSNVQLIATDWA